MIYIVEIPCCFVNILTLCFSGGLSVDINEIVKEVSKSVIAQAGAGIASTVSPAVSDNSYDVSYVSSRLKSSGGKPGACEKCGKCKSNCSSGKAGVLTMNETSLKRLIRNTVLTALAKQGKYYFPVAVSARHVHLSQKDFEALFGPGKTMTPYKALSQPGQFACEETVELTGPKGSIKKVRILGPARNETQVEISVSDSFVLGLKPDIRVSGVIAGTPGCTLSGPQGKVTIAQGVIVAARHLHISEEQAAAYGLKEGEAVSIKTPAPREGLLGNITVRIGKDFDLEIHLDTDEANGNGILCGTIFAAGCNKNQPLNLPAAPCPEEAAGSGAALDLITERDVNNAILRGEHTLYCTAKGLISPAAADRAKGKGITICKLRG